jgi:hypothetical protein
LHPLGPYIILTIVSIFARSHFFISWVEVVDGTALGMADDTLTDGFKKLFCISLVAWFRRRGRERLGAGFFLVLQFADLVYKQFSPCGVISRMAM